MKSIQSKILFVVISGLLVMTFVVSAIAVTMTHEIMHQDADRILKNMCQKEAAYINDMLNDITKSASIIEHYATTELENAQALADEQYREKYVGKVETLFNEIALNTDGIEGFYLRLTRDYPTDGFYNIITDDKTIEAAVPTDLSLYPESDTENVGWYYAAVNAKEGVWVEPYMDRETGKELISYIVPIYSDGAFTGVVGFDIDFNYFVEHINNIAVYKNGYTLLYSKDMQTVYNHSPEYEESHSSKHPHTNASVLLHNGMTLELRADYKDIQRDIRPMMTQIVLAFILVLAVFILYTIVVTRKIVAPLKKLTAAVKGIVDGKTEVRLPTDSKDEIGTLSKVLEDTYKRLMEYTKYINALAYRDSLTGIKNRTAYDEATEELDKKINCANPSFGVLVADINNLKDTNDKYGHDVGNELIIHTAKILGETFKSSSLFRIGGDEFVVILENRDLEQYHTLLNKMDDACSADYISVNDKKIPVSIAHGVAIYDPSIDKVFDDVFNNADHAMYMHKQSMKMLTV
ncbi:MAG: diguanylate cyclase [Clostridia bacterium]|nr:diguanylate cyclase [Clostridia bacterium]